MQIFKIMILLVLTINTGYSKYTYAVKPKEEINIYLFWGDGCPHCEYLIEFFEEMEDEYGDYYNLVKYEVWSNKENKQLMNQVSNLLNDNARGVPYLIIGDTSINGYSNSKNEYIKKTILKQYNKFKRFDALEKIKE